VISQSHRFVVPTPSLPSTLFSVPSHICSDQSDGLASMPGLAAGNHSNERDTWSQLTKYLATSQHIGRGDISRGRQKTRQAHRARVGCAFALWGLPGARGEPGSQGTRVALRFSPRGLMKSLRNLLTRCAVLGLDRPFCSFSRSHRANDASCHPPDVPASSRRTWH